MKGKPVSVAIVILGLAVLTFFLAVLRPVSAYDAKVVSDSATVSVATSADGMHVYICDAKRCYASHDSGKTFTRLKVE